MQTFKTSFKDTITAARSETNRKLIILSITDEFEDSTTLLLSIEDVCKVIKALKLELAE